MGIGEGVAMPAMNTMLSRCTRPSICSRHACISSHQSCESLGLVVSFSAEQSLGYGAQPCALHIHHHCVTSRAPICVCCIPVICGHAHSLVASSISGFQQVLWWQVGAGAGAISLAGHGLQRHVRRLYRWPVSVPTHGGSARLAVRLFHIRLSGRRVVCCVAEPGQEHALRRRAHVGQRTRLHKGEHRCACEPLHLLRLLPVQMPLL